MYESLSIGEISIYCITWVSGVLYSLYKLWEATDYMNPNRQNPYEIGRSFIAEDSDGIDSEWETWVPFLLFKTPWLVSHFVGAELVRRNNIELLPVWYILISSIFLLNFVGTFITGLILLQLSLVYTCMLLFRSRLFLWAVCLAILFVFNHEGQNTIKELIAEDHTVSYLMLVTLSWLLLRSLSFCIDNLTCPPDHPTPVDFVLYLSYCLYLPVLVLGPIIIYSDFQHGLKQPYKKWTFTRIICAFCSILRYIFWGLIIDVFLQYLFFVPLYMIPTKVMGMGNWALYGYGYAMGQLFMLKYVIIYGIGSTIARLEQIDAPHHPRCIARIHLYSYMWRHFDRGLYLFLVKYIYIPCGGKNKSAWKKLFASFMCFVFIYIWHATYVAILIWTVLNFLGITLEGVGKQISVLPAYRKWEDSVLSARGIRRFHALISTPIFMMSVLGNFYFLGSYTIGYIFLTRILNDSFVHNMYLFLFCYCCSQVSIEVGNWEQRSRFAMKHKSQ